MPMIAACLTSSVPVSGGLEHQEIDGFLDNQGDYQLEKIDHEQTQNPCRQGPSIFYKIGPEGFQIGKGRFKGNFGNFPGTLFHEKGLVYTTKRACPDVTRDTIENGYEPGPAYGSGKVRMASIIFSLLKMHPVIIFGHCQDKTWDMDSGACIKRP